jgi:hypothetical protein
MLSAMDLKVIRSPFLQQKGRVVIEVKRDLCKAFEEKGFCEDKKTCVYKHIPKKLCKYYHTYGYCKSIKCKFKHSIEGYDKHFEQQKTEIYWTFKKPVKVMTTDDYGDYWTIDGRIFYSDKKTLRYDGGFYYHHEEKLHVSQIKEKKRFEHYWHDGHKIIHQFERRYKLFELLYSLLKLIPIDILYIIIDDYSDFQITSYKTEYTKDAFGN